MSLLSVQNLNVALSHRTVLDGLSFDAGRGELIGLIGPNGAGKTTLLRALADLIPFEGDIRLGGEKLAAIGRKTLARQVSYVAQGHEVHWPVSASQAVMLGRLPHIPALGSPGEADRHAVTRAMARADVTQFAERNVLSLSEGERARVLIARALAAEAPILLVDEPVAALDPYHQLQIMEVLRATADDGALVIAVLHDLTLASRFAHRIVLLQDGRIGAEGQAGEILSDETLIQAYGIKAARGEHKSAPFIVPWERTRN